MAISVDLHFCGLQICGQLQRELTTFIYHIYTAQEPRMSSGDGGGGGGGRVFHREFQTDEKPSASALLQQPQLLGR